MKLTLRLTIFFLLTKISWKRQLEMFYLDPRSLWLKS
jgi:hypothetical protein